MNLQTDPLDNQLTTRPIQMGGEIGIEPYPNWQCGCIDVPDNHFGDDPVHTQTRTPSNSLEPLLSLSMSDR